jgi:hypothetical protein
MSRRVPSSSHHRARRPSAEASARPSPTTISTRAGTSRIAADLHCRHSDSVYMHQQTGFMIFSAWLFCLVTVRGLAALRGDVRAVWRAAIFARCPAAWRGAGRLAFAANGQAPACPRCARGPASQGPAAPEVGKIAAPDLTSGRMAAVAIGQCNWRQRRYRSRCTSGPS